MVWCRLLIASSNSWHDSGLLCILWGAIAESGASALVDGVIDAA